MNVQDIDEATDIEGELFSDEELADGVGELVGPESLQEEELLQALYKDLYRGEQAKAVLAEAQMREVAALNAQLEHRPIDGLGVLAARVPMEVYLAWMAREGPDFWHERSNLDYFAHKAEGRGNPGFLIRTQMRTTIIKPDFPGATPGHGDKQAGAAGVAAPANPGRGVRGRRGRWAA